MKRIILLVLILAVTPFLLESEKTLNQQVEEIRRSNSKNPETANWEYVKDRVFEGETSVFRKLEGPILIELMDASKTDSLLVSEIILDIREILPHKEVHFFNDFIGMSFSEMVIKGFKANDSIRKFTFEKIADSRIHIRFEPSNLYRNSNNDFIQLGQGYSIQSHSAKRINDKIIRQPFMTVSIGDVYSYDEKKKYLTAGLLRQLVFLQNDSDVDGRSVFWKKEITGMDHFILDRDIFLLKKLYSDNFLTQFEDYLYAHYPWRYAYSFLHKKKMELLALGLVSLLGIIVFLLLFSLFQGEKFKNPFLNYYVPVVLIWAHLVNLKSIYTYLTDFTTVTSWGSSVLFMLIAVPLFALVTSFIMWGLDKAFLKEHSRFSSQLALKVVFTLIAFLTPHILIFFFDNHENEGIDFFLPEFFLFVALAIGRGIFFYLNQMSDSLVKQKDVELSHLKEINAQAELKLLQSHINPQFLYNALNSIAGLAHDDADKTEKMALSLSDLFRYSINKKGEKMSTVSEEVTLVENYLEIEKIRFGERLEFTLTIDEDAKEEKIPMFMLQPLIENAIKHGVSKIGGDAKISLDIKKDKEGLLITVGDNGPAFPQGLVSGHGLQTVYDLLRLSYGDKASLSWENTPRKQIVISINNK